MAPDENLTVTLTAAQWNGVLTILSRGKFAAVAGLIGEIQRQCNEQAQADTAPQAPALSVVHPDRSA